MNPSKPVNHMRRYAVGSAFAAVILLSPVAAFLMVVAIELLIDLSMAAGARALAAVAVTCVGLLLSRKFSRSSSRVIGGKCERIARV
jgi:hypothetical protein